MKIFEKMAVSIDNTIDLILGEYTQRPADLYLCQYPDLMMVFNR